MPDGMNMNMTSEAGFCGPANTNMLHSVQSILFARTPCLIFLFEGWVMDSAGLVILGMFGCWVLAFIVAALESAKGLLSSRTATYGTMFVKTFLGYFLMLLAMTFSVELMLFAALGLVCGHATVKEYIIPLCGGLETEAPDDVEMKPPDPDFDYHAQNA